ncbi:1-deoxy-D-xylulose-5-phosphate synthase [Limisalsivibrio acetivorans]|uniref:1-deoxy-D-xylulose-5-phosphate synthase n=1 Tax=Limisalsivibrio acetivorans TaxID=1304888 RepID=UPI0003B35BC4|nr:1-deoxy-D-xylulose-5-phosphate synthase [Limisalsivibrio acetivorans]
MSLTDSLKLPDDIQEIDYDEIDKLAEETRELIIDTVSKNGGHLAPSLGVVELTLSLLRNFSPAADRIVWDVGHQSYAFKILTDRKHRFKTLRQYKGISGFIKPAESSYDSFGVGHTSTSISAGLGMSVADGLKERDRKIVSVIGDGAMTAGMAFEALNNLGHLDKRMIVVLNDNEMSIGSNVGGVAAYLSNLMTGKVYTKFRKDVQHLLEKRPLGPRLLNIAKKMEEGLVGMFTPGILFEELGLRYIGPVNGHRVKDLDKAFQNALIQDGPVIIHVSTTKGKGYKPAEEDPSRFHGVSSFDIETGKSNKLGTSKSYTDIFGETITEIGHSNPNVVAISAAMRDGTGLAKFEEAFPDRFFDVGIAEQHAVTFAAGMAISGMRPYVAIYSTFLQRAFDQIIHDVALQNLPVTLCIDRGGFVGADGPTHHGIYDISFLRCVPDLNIMLPKDGTELSEMLRLSLGIKAPVSIRYARGTAHSYDEYGYRPVVLGEPEVIDTGGDIAVVSAGHIFEEASRLHTKLKDAYGAASLINLRFIKPLNRDMLVDALKGKKLIVTVEEGSIRGGAGEEVQSILMDAGKAPRVIRFGVPDRFIEHGGINDLRKLCGLTAEQMFETVSGIDI